MSDEVLRFDFSSFERMARKLEVGRQQLPYALSRSLNESAFATRSALIGMWPQHVEVRNPAFIRWALGVERSTKHNLTVKITDARAQGRGHLRLHAFGGTRLGQGSLAVPIGAKRGRAGVVSSQRPRNLKRSFKRGDAIYALTGRGKKKALKLMFVLKRTTPVRMDVPFVEVFKATMQTEMQQRAPKAMLEAMKTAIRK